MSVCHSPAPGAGRGASKTPRGGGSGSPQARGHIRPWPGLQQPGAGQRAHPPGANSSQREPGSRDITTTAMPPSVLRSRRLGSGPCRAPGACAWPLPSSSSQKNATITELIGEGLKEPMCRAGPGGAPSPEQPRLSRLGVTAHVQRHARPRSLPAGTLAEA